VARLAEATPDFNGTWENGSGYDFIQPQKGADGSILPSAAQTCSSGWSRRHCRGSAPACQRAAPRMDRTAEGT